MSLDFWLGVLIGVIAAFVLSTLAFIVFTAIVRRLPLTEPHVWTGAINQFLHDANDHKQDR